MEIKPEVISVSAAPTYELVLATNVHACPNNKHFNYYPAPDITFRKKGSFMEAIYTIEKIILLDPEDKEQLLKVNSKYKKQLAHYIQRRPDFKNFDRGEHRFYIVSKKLDLPHLPYTVGYEKQCYFTLDELTKGHQDVRTTKVLSALKENKKRE